MSNPSIRDKDFYKKINKKYKYYYINKKRTSLKKICFPKSYKLQIPQKFVSKYINPNTNYKGILVFHRLGSGKTCTGIRVGETWKHLRKIMIVLPASLKGNFRNELRTRCSKDSYISEKDRNRLQNLHPSSKEYKNIIRKSDEIIDKYYEIYSYNKFIELCINNSISFRNKILIIDEIQNMISEKGTYYNVLYNKIEEAPESLRIVLLSATPMFDKPLEIALTMNLLKLSKPFPIGSKFEKRFVHKRTRGSKIYYSAKNLDLFKKKIKGYISFYKGAPQIAFPKRKVRYIKCKMSNFQYKSYVTVKKNEEKQTSTNKIKKLSKLSDGSIKDLPNNFFIGTRIISNVSFPNKYIGEKGFNSFNGNYLEMKNLKKYSIKFYKILTKIKRQSGTIFIYSNFKEFGGIRSFVKVLEYHGYKNYIKNGEGYRRFAIWSGDQKHETKEEIKEVFNNPKNIKGSRIKILLGSPSIKEGVSLYRVQSVHVLEPYWNKSRLEQVIGRAIRFCSHKDMEPDKREVKVYIYISVHDKEKMTVDQYINKMSIRKNKLVKEFEQAIKESSVDCTLNENLNTHKGDIPIICDK